MTNTIKSNTPQYSMTVKVTKPNTQGRRDVYGEVTITGHTDSDFKSSIAFAMNEFMNQLN